MVLGPLNGNRRRILVATLGLLLGLAYWLGARAVEARIAQRLADFSRSSGVAIRYRSLHVGLFPPVRLDGVQIERPGQAAVRLEWITASPRLRGENASKLVGLVSLGPAVIDLPAGLRVTARPTTWEADPGGVLTLLAPVSGLRLEASRTPRGRAFDVTARTLRLDALLSVILEGDASRDLGSVDGSAHAEGDPAKDFQATWRFRAFGGETGGSLIVLPDPEDARVQFQASMKGLDFAHILRSLSVDAPAGSNALGSLSGTVSVAGRLHDPASLEVAQRIDFKRPEKAPAEVLRLRGPFTHEVTTSEGATKRIEVSPDSPDFIPVTEVPALFIRTLLIAEDAAFFGHPGIDLTEMPRAIATNIARGGAVRGASTITQQLAKNLFLTREKSLQRKLRELSYSFLLESTLGKIRILEIYVNIIEWGPGLYGLRPAARHYFAKEPQALTPREVAFLVSMIPGPIKYQRSIQGGELRRGMETLVNNLLVKMRSIDVISEEALERAQNETLVFRGAAAKLEAAPPR